jgi:hypothetical protein
LIRSVPAELRIGLHQSQHVLAIQFDQLTLLGGTHPDDSRAAREVVDLTSELTRAMNGNKGLNTARGTHNFDLAGDHHKEWDISISLLNEHLARLHCTHISMRCNATNLRRS